MDFTKGLIRPTDIHSRTGWVALTYGSARFRPGRRLRLRRGRNQAEGGFTMVQRMFFAVVVMSLVISGVYAVASSSAVPPNEELSASDLFEP